MLSADEESKNEEMAFEETWGNNNTSSGGQSKDECSRWKGGIS